MVAESRVTAVPGRADLRLHEVRRPDGSWRVVADPPPDAATPGSLFDDLAPAGAEPSMHDWLALLEAQRRTVLVGLLTLTHGYDAERVFSHDDFDRAYDADLAACADAAVPLLVAIDEAIGRVREVVARPRGGGG